MPKKYYYYILPFVIFAAGLTFLLGVVEGKAQGSEVWAGLGATAEEAGIVAEGQGKSIKDNSPTSVPILIGKIIGIFLSFLGVIFLILTIYGGFLWMTAGGNEEQVGKAKKIIVCAVVGLFLVLAASAITAFITEELAEASGIKATSPTSGISPPSPISALALAPPNVAPIITPPSIP